MSEVKKTYGLLVDPIWKIQNNSKISSFLRKSLSKNRDNSKENYKKIQDDRINNYYKQTMEITLDDGTKETIQVLKKPRHPDEYRIIIPTNGKNESHSYKIIPDNKEIVAAIESYRVKKIPDDQVIQSIYEWLDILISNNNDCTYILYENDHRPRMTSYEIIAIGNKLQSQSEKPLFVNVNGCMVEDDNTKNEMTECNENVVDCPNKDEVSIISKGGAKLRKHRSRKLGRKLGSRKSKSRKYHKK